MSNGNSILNLLYKGTTTIQDFQWDNMATAPIMSLITPEEIGYIRDLIMSPRYSGNVKLKLEKIDAVMNFRGFTRFAGGTNRVVYTHPSAPNAVFKVALDSVGINDNPAEYYNQRFLKPYCCKVFECSSCGTIASFERVERITTFEEFYTIADDYFYILSRVILGKYVMEDIGIDYFMNIGIRKGCHPVILDFPYLFELDGGKLECYNQLDDGSICHGEIDYDNGFNKLVCKKCGRVYRARDLAKPPKESHVLLKQKGGAHMKIVLKRGNDVLVNTTTDVERDFLSPKDPEMSKSGIRVTVTTRDPIKSSSVEDRMREKHITTTNEIHHDKHQAIKEMEPEKKSVTIRPIHISLNGGTKAPASAVVTDPIDHDFNVRVLTREITKPASEAIIEPASTTAHEDYVKPSNIYETVLKEPMYNRVVNASIGKVSVVDPVIVGTSDKNINMTITGGAIKEDHKPTEEPKVEFSINTRVLSYYSKETINRIGDLCAVGNTDMVTPESMKRFFDGNYTEKLKTIGYPDAEAESLKKIFHENFEDLTDEEKMNRSIWNNIMNYEVAALFGLDDVDSLKLYLSDPNWHNSFTNDGGIWPANSRLLSNFGFSDEYIEKLGVDNVDKAFDMLKNDQWFDILTAKGFSATEAIYITHVVDGVINDPDFIRSYPDIDSEVKQEYSCQWDDAESSDEEIDLANLNPSGVPIQAISFDDDPDCESFESEPETSEEDTTDESSEEDDEDDDDSVTIEFVDDIPEVEDAKANVYYFVRKDPDTDVSVYAEVTDPRVIDENLFAIYYLYEDAMIRITYNYDTGVYEEYEGTPVNHLDESDTVAEAVVDPVKAEKDSRQMMIDEIMASAKRPDISGMINK